MKKKIFREYQRQHLRAPFGKEILFWSDGHCFQATVENISEGGLLISELPFLPQEKEIPLLIRVPRLKNLRELNIGQLEVLSDLDSDVDILSVVATPVRQVEEKSASEVFHLKLGMSFSEIADNDKQTIKNYVDTFLNNIVTLQVAMDGYNASELTQKRVKLMSYLLGYGEVKASILKAQVDRDYVSLRWD